MPHCNSTSLLANSININLIETQHSRHYKIDEIVTGTDPSITNKKNSITIKKRKSFREAVIFEDGLELEFPRTRSNSRCSSHHELSMDHSETKRKILALREKYGEENWLSVQTASHIPGIIGLESTSAVSPIFSTIVESHQYKSSLISEDKAVVSLVPSKLSMTEQQRKENEKKICEENKDTMIKHFDLKYKHENNSIDVEAGVGTEEDYTEDLLTQSDIKKMLEFSNDYKKGIEDIYIFK